ncbi:MAG: hypothetical protein GY863_25160, partial [bacterium]|nr:hypothetical protein [bacterium]
MKKLIFAALIIGMSINSYGQSADVPGPSFKDIMNIKSLGSPVISPDGNSILYTIRKTDWDK